MGSPQIHDDLDWGPPQETFAPGEAALGVLQSLQDTSLSNLCGQVGIPIQNYRGVDDFNIWDLMGCNGDIIGIQMDYGI